MLRKGHILAILVIGVSIITTPSVFAVDFVDSSGYTPSWAKGEGYQSVLMECTELVGDFSRDGDWCLEWTAYVLDQGIENFPESTSSKQTLTISASDFELEEGPIYDGPLTSFLPGSYGANWFVGKPFTAVSIDKIKAVGMQDVVRQRLVIPDDEDPLTVVKLEFIVMKFENQQKADQFYENIKNQIDSQGFLTVGEYFEQYSQGKNPDRHILEKTTSNFWAECYGMLLNIEKEDEESGLNCIKDDYVITSLVAWNNYWVDNKYQEYAKDPETMAKEYAEIIIKKIDPSLKSEPIKFNQEFGDDFLDMNEESQSESKSVELSEDDLPRFGDVEQEETPLWATGLAAFVLFGLPVIIIGLIIWKIKKRKKVRA